MENHIAIIISILTLISIIWGFRDKIFGRGKTEQKIEDRVCSLEEDNKIINSKLDEINKGVNNHLTDVNKSITKIEVNLSAINTTLEFLKKK